MTHRQRTARPSGAVSQAGLLLSLVGTLDNPRGPLGKRASGLAHRLSDGSATAAELDAAAAVLALLLDETDADTSGYESEGLLDGGFDDL
jgi:hypothetical protein